MTEMVFEKKLESDLKAVNYGDISLSNSSITRSVSFETFLRHLEKLVPREKVRIFTAKCLLYLPLRLAFRNSTFCSQSVIRFCVWISGQTAIISLYSFN
jgi:hypothetical protein